MADSTSIEVPPKAAAISLKDVSPEARELLSVIDVDGDGVLQLEELQHAANMLAEYKKNSGNIKLDALPPRLQEQLAAFDVDGDGDLSVAEVARAVDMYKAANQRARHLAWLASGLLIALLAIIAITFGVTYASSMAVVKATKDLYNQPNNNGGNAQLTDANGNLVSTAGNVVPISGVSTDPVTGGTSRLLLEHGALTINTKSGLYKSRRNRRLMRAYSPALVRRLSAAAAHPAGLARGLEETTEPESPLLAPEAVYEYLYKITTKSASLFCETPDAGKREMVIDMPNTEDPEVREKKLALVRGAQSCDQIEELTKVWNDPNYARRLAEEGKTPSPLFIQFCEEGKMVDYNGFKGELCTAISCPAEYEGADKDKFNAGLDAAICTVQRIVSSPSTREIAYVYEPESVKDAEGRRRRLAMRNHVASNIAAQRRLQDEGAENTFCAPEMDIDADTYAECSCGHSVFCNTTFGATLESGKLNEDFLLIPEAIGNSSEMIEKALWNQNFYSYRFVPAEGCQWSYFDVALTNSTMAGFAPNWAAGYAFTNYDDAANILSAVSMCWNTRDIARKYHWFINSYCRARGIEECTEKQFEIDLEDQCGPMKLDKDGIYIVPEVGYDDMGAIPDGCRAFLDVYAEKGFPVCKSPRFLSNQLCLQPELAW